MSWKQLADKARDETPRLALQQFKCFWAWWQVRLSVSKKSREPFDRKARDLNDTNLTNRPSSRTKEKTEETSFSWHFFITKFVTNEERWQLNVEWNAFKWKANCCSLSSFWVLIECQGSYDDFSLMIEDDEIEETNFLSMLELSSARLISQKILSNEKSFLRNDSFFFGQQKLSSHSRFIKTSFKFQGTLDSQVPVMAFTLENYKTFCRQSQIEMFVTKKRALLEASSLLRLLRWRRNMKLCKLKLSLLVIEKNWLFMREEILWT